MHTNDLSVSNSVDSARENKALVWNAVSVQEIKEKHTVDLDAFFTIYLYYLNKYKKKNNNTVMFKETSIKKDTKMH